MFVLPHPFRETDQRIWTRSQALTGAECERILDAVGPYEPARVGYPDPRPDEARSSETAGVGWGPDVSWIYERLGELVTEANEKLFGFDLTGLFEQASVVRYPTGGHHEWHIDLGTGPYSCRKLTIVVQLSSAEDFEGGRFELHPSVDHDDPVLDDRGDLLMFPTWVPHRVHPVTTGTRHSLVAWVGGPPFR